LRRDIEYFVQKYKISGRIIDVGCGQKPFGGIFSNSEYLGIDFASYSKNKDAGTGKPDYFFAKDYEKYFLLPFENESFDNAVSFQVLEHHPKPEIMISELARVTKKRGLILIACPFIYALHEEPRDFQRLTHYKLKEILGRNGCEVVAIKKQGSFFSAVSMLANEQLNHFAVKNSLNYFLAVIFYPLFLLCQYTGILIDFFIRSDIVFINYAILAKKKS
jgi:SAM-dependent methyltransferase